MARLISMLRRLRERKSLKSLKKSRNCNVSLQPSKSSSKKAKIYRLLTTTLKSQRQKMRALQLLKPLKK